MDKFMKVSRAILGPKYPRFTRLGEVQFVLVP